MLQIIIVYVLARNIGNKVAAKGHRRLPYQLTLIALWLGGEFAGAFAAAFVQQVFEPGEGVGCITFVCALAGAVIGAIIAFAIANNASPVQNDDDFYEIDERGRDDEIRRGWREANDRPFANGDQIQERPAVRREDDRIRE